MSRSSSTYITQPSAAHRVADTVPCAPSVAGPGGLAQPRPVDRVAFSINEFAAAVGIGRTTLYAEIRAGRLKPIKVGARTIIPVTESEAWLRRLRAETSPDGDDGQ